MGYQIQSPAFRVHVVEIDRGGHDAARDAERAYRSLEPTGGAEQMSSHGLRA